MINTEIRISLNGKVNWQQLVDIGAVTGLDPKKLMLVKAIEKVVEKMDRIDNIVGMEFDLNVVVTVKENEDAEPENTGE